MTDHLRIITWNIWFDPINIIERTHTIIKIIKSEQPDFVCLQEVTCETLALLRKQLRDYHLFEVFSKSGCGYGVCILSHNSKVVVIDELSHPYPYTMMNRQLLHCRAFIKRFAFSVDILTTHLESCYQSKEIRSLQFETVKEQFNYETNALIFLGDLNISHYEPLLNKIKATPLQDAWTTLGCKEEHKWTCDGRTNPNLSGKWHFRFDRIYYLSNNSKSNSTNNSNNQRKLIPSQMKLLGKDKTSETIPNPPSDHYGVLVDFMVTD